VGKTRLSAALLRALAARGLPALGLKPIETGIWGSNQSIVDAAASDATALIDASSVRTGIQHHPLYALREPVSPHLAARRAGTQIELGLIARWTDEAERSVTPHVTSSSALWTVIETAGGVFSPLAPGTTNFDLAQTLGPAIWVLVAADALGVLHDVSSCLQAMRACGREPDHLVLSAARDPDASTGSNSAELEALGIAAPAALLARNDDRGVTQLLDRLLEVNP